LHKHWHSQKGSASPFLCHQGNSVLPLWHDLQEHEGVIHQQQSEGLTKVRH